MKKNKFIILAGFLLAMGTSAFADSKWDIRVFIPDVDKYDHKDLYVQAADKYRKETGGKVDIVSGSADGGEVILLANRYNGTPLDMVYIRDSDFQRYINQEYIKETGWYINTLKMNIDDESVINSEVESKLFTRDEVPFAESQVYGTNAYVVVYNKSLMVKEGIASSVSPKMLYSRGQWTLDKMKVYAKKLNKVSDSQGLKSVIGLGTKYPEIFPYINGSPFVQISDRGTSNLKLLDKGVKDALYYLYDGVKEGWLTTNPELITESFKNRELAMVICLDKDVPELIEGLEDTIEYVRLPAGPDVKRSQNVTTTYGFAITSDSEKETSCGRYLEYILRETYLRDKAERENWPAELVELSKSVIEAPDFYPYPDATLKITFSNLIDEIVFNQVQPEVAIYKYQLKAADIVSHTKDKMVYEPSGFRGVVQTFNRITNNDGYFRTFPGSKSGSAALVSGRFAIQGKSLEIEFKPAIEGNGAYIVLTDSEKLGLVGWRNYEISFDVRVEGNLDLNSVVYAQVFCDSNTQYGRVVEYITETGKVYHVVGEFNGIMKTGRVSMCFGIAGCNSAVIDNITVIEK